MKPCRGFGLMRHSSVRPGASCRALGLTTFAAILLAWWGHALRGRTAQAWLSRSLAVVILVFQGPMQLVMLLPAQYDVGRSLPLQICDLAWFIRDLRALDEPALGFRLGLLLGLTATLLAMLTPDLKHGFPSFYFLQFYFGHGPWSAAAVYLCWGRGLRPDWRLYRLTVVVTIAYAIGIFVVNEILDTNYFCINRKPPPGTMLDYFGPVSDANPRRALDRALHLGRIDLALATAGNKRRPQPR